jgi:hypothetical protein
VMIGNDGSICRYAHIECNFVLKVFWGPLAGQNAALMVLRCGLFIFVSLAER